MKSRVCVRPAERGSRRRFLKKAAVVAGGAAGAIAFPGVMRLSSEALSSQTPAASDKGATLNAGLCDANKKGASPATREANATLFRKLSFADEQDFADARRGLIGQSPETVIRSSSGDIVWNLNPYAFLNGNQQFDTINPSLKRQAALNNIHGLFQLTDRVYQIRGYDLANMGIIVGDTGYIIIDPLTSMDTSKAAAELLYRHLGKKPVVAVVYSHSHADHWGGVKGVISEDDVTAGKVRVIAPAGFMDAAVSENIFAGNAMIRRTYYMYGATLPRDAQGQVDAGIGKSLPRTLSPSLIPPTDTVTATGQEMIVDGVRIVFQMAPGSEAPAEMHLYFPQFQALFMADNCVTSLHNLLTPRGARVRNSLAWTGYIYEAIDLFVDKSEVVFVGHGHPLWGKSNIARFLKKQADIYKYIHDQTLRLANNGYTMAEIAEAIEPPDELGKEWFNRGYYATAGWNAKAVYQYYLGWHDANPAHVNELPPAEKSRRYVEFMGGADQLLSKAKESFARGEYRWVAEVMNHLVFADPQNEQARYLQADTLEQLGYQSESAVFRNFYLFGAQELREGVQKLYKKLPPATDVYQALTIDMIFDSMAVRINGTKAAGKTMAINWHFTDIEERHLLLLENAVLNHRKVGQDKDADVSLKLPRSVFIEIITGQATFLGRMLCGQIAYKGNIKKLSELMSLLDEPDPWFNIVTP